MAIGGQLSRLLLRETAKRRASDWGESHIVIPSPPFPGPLRYENYPWSRGMLDSTAEHNVGMKAAQMAYTTSAIVISLYTIDVRGNSVLYLLPNQHPDAGRFSSTKFQPVLDTSPYVANMFTDVSNVREKRAGPHTLYIGGSNSRSALKSISVGLIVFDEYDEMPIESIELATQRLRGQINTQIWKISTPTIPHQGIHGEYLQSSQEHFRFPCPCCGKLIEFIFPDSLEVCGDHVNDPDISRSRLRCTECNGTLKHEEKPEYLGRGDWFPDAVSDSRGFYICGLASPSKYGRADTIARDAIRARSNTTVEQELWNSCAGLPFIAAGSNVNLEHIQRCTGGHSKRDLRAWSAGPVTAGIDVGKWFHIVVNGWHVPKLGYDINASSRVTVLFEGMVASYKELRQILTEWQATLAVIDWEPEPRATMEFAKAFHGRVIRCQFGGTGTKTLAADWANYHLKAARTFWLDAALGRFRNGSIRIPHDSSDDYKSQICDPVRRTEPDADGNPVGRWIGRKADHFALAQSYAEMSLPLVASFNTGRNIESFL